MDLYRTPYHLLSDQGSNVDGQLMRKFFSTLRIEKRLSSAYHSQGNGFTERNIVTVKDMLPAVLLYGRLPQSQRGKLLPSLVFALNTSLSKATQCVPYNVVFERAATLPQDIVFHDVSKDEFEEPPSAATNKHTV